MVDALPAGCYQLIECARACGWADSCLALCRSSFYLGRGQKRGLLPLLDLHNSVLGSVNGRQQGGYGLPPRVSMLAVAGAGLLETE